MEEGEVTKNDLMEERDFCGKIHIANRKEEEVWNLRSQSLWLKLGNKITTFCHKQTKVELQENTMNEISLRCLTYFASIKEASRDHFEALYIEEVEDHFVGDAIMMEIYHC
jgi:hypothetical protein